jgi:two-component system LytT family sensor kinase
MNNPITGNRVYFLAYLLVWIIFAVIQASIEFFVFETSMGFALTDSLVFNFIFVILGIAMWYPVRYMSFSEKNVIPAILNHLVLGVAMLFLWAFTGYIILKVFIGGDQFLLSFLELSMPYRSVIGMLIFILLIMLYYLIVYSENLKQRINTEANLKTLVREAELSALKAQINPHFLFNSLNSVSSLTMRDPSRARKMIIELSEFLRYSLKHKEKEVTSLEEEIQNITRYLEIEKIRFEGRLIFEMEVPGECKSLRLPNMILQPLFENAIKHGVYESIEPVTIHLKCECNSEFLTIVISNNYDASIADTTGAGIGLKNISSRLKLIYGNDDLLKSSGYNGIYKVILKIPVKVN